LLLEARFFVIGHITKPVINLTFPDFFRRMKLAAALMVACAVGGEAFMPSHGPAALMG
jgi:hypothetical protein